SLARLAYISLERTKPMKTINATLLREKDACESQVALFVELFGERSIKPTLALCKKHAHVFDFASAAESLLPAALRADYETKRAPLWADYAAKSTPLRADYA